MIDIVAFIDDPAVAQYALALAVLCIYAIDRTYLHLRRRVERKKDASKFWLWHEEYMCTAKALQKEVTAMKTRLLRMEEKFH